MDIAMSVCQFVRPRHRLYLGDYKNYKIRHTDFCTTHADEVCFKFLSRHLSAQQILKYHHTHIYIQCFFYIITIHHIPYSFYSRPIFLNVGVCSLQISKMHILLGKTQSSKYFNLTYWIYICIGLIYHHWIWIRLIYYIILLALKH